MLLRRRSSIHSRTDFAIQPFPHFRIAKDLSIILNTLDTLAKNRARVYISSQKKFKTSVFHRLEISITSSTHFTRQGSGPASLAYKDSDALTPDAT